jgi:predicted  nucleic acid-binding Zn-ribbon protein
LAFNEDDRKTISELRVKVAAIEESVNYIKSTLDEIKNSVKALNTEAVESKVKREALSKDLEALTDVVKNHLNWHKEERAKVLSYAGITAGLVASILSFILRLIFGG